MELKQIEKIAKALSDVNRLKILQHMQANKGRIECVAIAQLLNLAQPSISHHIKKLAEAGLIEAQKEGRYHNYTFNKKLWKTYLRALAHMPQT